MDPHTAEDGELEDGEICDDETEERAPPRRGDGYRPGRGAHPRAHKRHQRPRGGPPLLGPSPPDFPFPMPYGLGPHAPFPPSHRQQCGPSGPERPPTVPPPAALLPPPPELGPHGEPSPRGSFWERSHGALGRFRHRVLPNGGRGGWSRGGRGGNNRSLPGRYGPAEIHDSPSRKQKPPPRTRPRKGVHSVPKADSSVEESFEDLLSKYKQIQLELECIRKEETMALAPAAPPAAEEELDAGAGLPEAQPGPESGSEPAVDLMETETAEKKVFQAFNLKPLRQKLPTPAQLDQLHRKCSEAAEGGGPQAQGQEPITEEPEDRCVLCGEAATETEVNPAKVWDQNRPGTCGSCRVSGVTTRSAAAAERRRTRSTPADQDHQTADGPGPGPGRPPDTTRPGPDEPGGCRSEVRGDPPITAAGAAGSSGGCPEGAEPPGESSASSEDSSPPDRSLQRVEEEELSELQLRLLALQSASKKWQQKEQQVMKRSRDRMSRAPQDRGPAPGLPAPPSGRSRVTTRSAAAAERTRTKSKATDRDRTKSTARPLDRDRDRDRPKPGPKVLLERSRPPGKSHLTKTVSSSHHQAAGSGVKQAVRKQQLRTWKLQQQREQDERRRQEEDERRKREEEIRRIRDLSNQDEQYNRFMKLVGGHRRPRSKSRDGDHRKSSGKGVLDSSGNLYQYDNYEEVAMDTDSETGSPVPSPTHTPAAEDPGHAPHPAAYRPDFYHAFLPPLLDGGPPPPPPLPPPPDEQEPPPKPPFADEEEEEEMLLRETCLMSMAHKRVTPAESSSGPPSPSAAPPAVEVQQPPRGNLSTVSLNTVSPAHRKFSRGRPAGRAPLMLPRHKAVVVSLGDSDDSDSDGDAGSSQTVFGGLEFMIKEARRTVEAAKPKAPSGSEKENNPLRSAAPEDRKSQSSVLKEDISREKPRTPRDPGLVSAPAAGPQTVVDSTLRAAAELQVAETQQRLSAFRDVLQEDEAVLRQLLQQVLKKSEALKAAEAKVVRLREQLQAGEKIANANRTLLRKLQEQVRRVEQRVSMKRSMVLRLENDVLDAQQHVGRGTKRKSTSSQPEQQQQRRRVAPPPGRSERHLAELMAHKQRLQQLESQYALKIQRLKAQALRNRAPPPDPPPAPAPPPAPPQPSLHDLTQDKLVLDSGDVPEHEDAEAAPSRRSSRRRSSSSFTKPHLDAPSPAPAREGGARPGRPPAETWTGLDVDALRQTYRQRTPVGELLFAELLKMQAGEDTPPAGQVVPLELEAATGQSGSSELRPAPFGAYRSPLLVFRSYRFSPYYRTKEKLSLSSVSFSNAVDINKRFCRFDLTGTCNHDGCSWQHMRDVTLTGNKLLEDIMSYSLPLIGCSDSSSDAEISAATESYMKKLFGLNRDRMGLDQKAVLLVSKVNESRRHVPPFTTCKDPRRWKPRSRTADAPVPEDDVGDEDSYLMPGRAEDLTVSVLGDRVDGCVTPEDRRYFLSETDDVWNLESSVADRPGDTQLWTKLAFKYLSQSHGSPEENLDAALNTLSRALEQNPADPELWVHYLSLFSRRGSREELQTMSETAVEHASSAQRAAAHRLWWKFLSLEQSFEGKDSVCERLLSFLMTEASPNAPLQCSFQLLEALLYRVELSAFSGRAERAVGLLQGALESEQGVGVAARLAPPDRAILWLSYIHLVEFGRLPSPLFDPAESGPSRLLRPTSFLLPWRTAEDVHTPLDRLLTLFRDGVSRCSEETASERERTQACMPLHLNLIRLYRLLHRFEDGVSQCESILRVCPDSCTVRGALAELHVCSGAAGRAGAVWLQAVQECRHNAEVLYHGCRFLMAQGQTDSAVSLFRDFVSSLCEDENQSVNVTDVLRHLLSLSTEDCLRGSVIKKEAEEKLREQSSFLHLLHCRWHWLSSSVERTVDAFEQALGSNLRLEELHSVWMDYLLFSCGPSARRAAAGVHGRTVRDLLHRCLSTVPSRLDVPFSPTHFYNCYTFHNQVVSLYLSLLPQSQHALLLERLHSAMPNNTELGLRLLLQLHDDGLLEQLRFQARLLSSSSPRCLSLWRILLAVQAELKQQVEVRGVCQQALQHLPLCADLWKHRLLLEAEVGGASERLRRLLEASEEAGVSVRLSGGF